MGMLLYNRQFKVSFCTFFYVNIQAIYRGLFGSFLRPISCLLLSFFWFVFSSVYVPVQRLYLIRNQYRLHTTLNDF